MKRRGAFLLRVLQTALLLASIAVALLAFTQLFPALTLRAGLTTYAMEFTARLPGWLALWGVLPAPTGGVFRTDLFVVALAALVASDVARRVAKGLK